ncbi:MAG TPA: hypothetical protein VI731_10950, partial [Bacteroidia bacterium]|nr:hypothetical protein [Bacteroidia bacterium]
MKKLLKIHLLVTFAIVSSATTLRAQWDTLEIFHSPNIGGMNDIHFVGSTGYVVGSQQVMNIYGQTGIIQKTTDGGLTWSAPQSIFSLGIDTIIELRSVYFISPSTGYVAAICVKNPWSATPYYSTILKTTNGGLTWSVVLSTENQMTVQYTVLFNSIQFMSPTHGFIAASNQTTSATWSNSGTGLVYVTMDGGISWNSSQTSATSLSNTVHFNSSGIGCAAGGVTFNRFGSGPYFDHTTGEIARSTDWGLTWTTVFSSPDGIIDMHFPSSQIGYALISGNSQLLKTTD